MIEDARTESVELTVSPASRSFRSSPVHLQELLVDLNASLFFRENVIIEYWQALFHISSPFRNELSSSFRKQIFLVEGIVDSGIEAKIDIEECFSPLKPAVFESRPVDGLVFLASIRSLALCCHSARASATVTMGATGRDVKTNQLDQSEAWQHQVEQTQIA